MLLKTPKALQPKRRTNEVRKSFTAYWLIFWQNLLQCLLLAALGRHVLFLSSHHPNWIALEMCSWPSPGRCKQWPQQEGCVKESQCSQRLTNKKWVAVAMTEQRSRQVILRHFLFLLKVLLARKTESWKEMIGKEGKWKRRLIAFHQNVNFLWWSGHPVKLEVTKYTSGVLCVAFEALLTVHTVTRQSSTIYLDGHPLCKYTGK